MPYKFDIFVNFCQFYAYLDILIDTLWTLLEEGNDLFRYNISFKK